jgi:hypothetical protein
LGYPSETRGLRAVAENVVRHQSFHFGRLMFHPRIAIWITPTALAPFTANQLISLTVRGLLFSQRQFLMPFDGINVADAAPERAREDGPSRRALHGTSPLFGKRLRDIGCRRSPTVGNVPAKVA